MILATGRKYHQGPTRNGERGMTLIEILIVVALMGLTAAIALPTLQRSQVQARADREMRSIRGLFDYARSEAIQRHAPVTVTPDADSDGSVDAGEREIRVLDSGGVELRRYTLRSHFIMDDTPAGFTPGADETALANFVYTADGSLDGGVGGALYFSDRRENYFRLFVTQFMGSPRAEMWTGAIWSPRRGDWEWK